MHHGCSDTRPPRRRVAESPRRASFNEGYAGAGGGSRNSAVGEMSDCPGNSGDTGSPPAPRGPDHADTVCTGVLGVAFRVRVA